MRRKLILMLFFVATLISQTASAQVVDQSVKLTMTFNNEPLQHVFLRLESSSPYKFLFTYDDIAGYTVTGKMRNAPFFDILKFVLKDTPLEYSVQGKFINITSKDGSKKAQAGAGPSGYRSIGGYVFDENNEPVIGAQVRVVGTKLMTVTDINGAFTFDYMVPENAQIQVSYVGLETTTVPVKKEMIIRMKADTQSIGEVVVTGIFKKAKESYTGSVSEISREKLDMYRGTNLLQTLKNIDASVNFPMNNVAGSNPNVLPNINIRGTSSLPMSVEEFNTNAAQTVNTPLIIMDGFEISLQKLMDYNDDQIESINILKDASATAIYGSRGANGVIVIISKQPKEGKLRVQVKAGLSLEIPDLNSYDMLEAKEKLELERLVGLYTSNYSPSTQYNYDQEYYTKYKAIAEGANTDWLSKPLRNGVGQRYNIQLDGGANEFRWGASLGYNNIVGAMKDSGRKNLTGDLTLMYSVKNLIFRNYATVTSNHARESKYGSFQDYVDQQPYFTPYTNSGKMKRYLDEDLGDDDFPNPLYDASLNTFNKSEYFEFMDNFSIEWLITQELRLRGQIGISTHRSSSDYFLPAEHSYFNTSTYRTEEGDLRKGRYTYGTGTTNLLSGNVTLSYSKTFAEKHQVYVGFDYSLSETTSNAYNFVAEGFTNADLNLITNAMQYEFSSAPTGNKYISRMMGFTGNVNYTYDNRYYIDLSYRVDGSSKFGSDKRFAPFWSAGIGWNIHNEKFMQNQKLFNNLRLKASYGITGTQDFTTESVYTSYQYTTGQRYINWSIANMMGLGNSELTWQKTKETNIGFEFGILKNRISGSLDIYSKKTSDLLSSMYLPLSTGFSSYVANVGEVDNKGFEASLNAYIIRDYEREFNWLIGGQLVYNKNKITKLSDAIRDQNESYLAQIAENVSNGVHTTDMVTLFYEGKPQTAIYGVKSAGIDPSTGYEMYYDRNGNITGVWDAADMVYLGDSQPRYRGTFNNMIMWKGFTVNVGFSYHWGGQLYNSTLLNRVEVTPTAISQRNVDKRVLYERWMQPGDNTFFRSFQGNVGNTHGTSRFVFDDRVLELSSLSLQYRWNNQWLKKTTGLESVVFAVNTSDLFYWSSVKYERGTSYPYARNFQGTVTVTF